MADLTLSEFWLAIKKSTVSFLFLLLVFGLPVILISFGMESVGVDEALNNLPAPLISALVVVLVIVFPKASADVMGSAGALLGNFSSFWRQRSFTSRLAWGVLMLLLLVIFVILPLFGVALVYYAVLLAGEIGEIKAQRRQPEPHAVVGNVKLKNDDIID